MRISRLLVVILGLLIVTLLLTAGVNAVVAQDDDDDDAPRVPHALPGRENCVSCHGQGQPEAFPRDHAGRSNATCLLCHPAPGMPAQPRPSAATLAAANQLPQVPHPIQGRENCLSCHGAGMIQPVPASHAGRDNPTCLVCHEVAPVATAPTAQPGAATALPPAGAIPTIPHTLQGRDDCLACHGAGQLRPVPASHAGRANSTCLGCHQAAGAVGATATTAPTVAATPVATSTGPAPAGPIPAIPHTLQGREDCLACHGPGQLRPVPASHAGRANSTCLGCHQPAGAAAASPTLPPTLAPTSAAATATPPAAPIPPIQHTLQGRDNCLACHGPGQVRPVPASHAGRDNSTCLGCHPPAAAGSATAAAPTTSAPAGPLQTLPTPIQEPAPFAENSCVVCHQGLGGRSAQITADWEQSAHAARGVGCVSCHGGDPLQSDATASMSPAAGFLGVPPKGQIPGLCASCHSRTDLMRQFGLPTDQFDQYWESRHGQALLEGDGNVATCFDCHGGHRVLKVSDPGSAVYPANEPATCASCHASAALMATYGIPADQLDKYTGSVHGIAVLQQQDPRAPTCSTCHGKHGAAPPGFQQVSNVCGQCHSATQDFYLQGAHKAGLLEASAPSCITCHGQHDVARSSRDLYLGTEPRHCGSCHQPGDPTAAKVDAIYQWLKQADDAYASSQALVAQARGRRLLTAEQEELLQRAQTPLIESRALQHTVDVEKIGAKIQESLSVSDQVRVSVEAALRELDTRRLGMIIALVAILLVVAVLIVIKLRLDRDLDAARAAQRRNP